MLACISLPALVVGSSIDAAPAPGELERLAAAHAGTMPSRLAAQFELATAPAIETWPEDAVAAARLLAPARLAQVAGVLALSMLIYLATLLARGRLAALAACIGFACLPAVVVEGHVLRPETAAVTYTALGLLLLQCLVSATHRRRARGVVRRRIVLALLAVSSASAIGLCVGTMPSLGGALMLPLVLATLVALQTGLRGLRIGRRRGFLHLPAHAITGRLWAPAVAALLAFVMALLCLHASLLQPSSVVPASELRAAIWPEQAVAAGLLQGIAAIGALSFLLRTGTRFGRRGRAGPGLVLLVYCATQLFYGFSAGDRFDPLPAAPALAILFGEGALALVAFCAWCNRRRVSAG